MAVAVLRALIKEIVVKQSNAPLGDGRYSSNGNTRTAGVEQYYTPPDLSHELVENFLAQFPHLADRTFIEPAAGTGSFLTAFEDNGIT